MPLHVSPAPAPALRSVLAALHSPTAVQGTHIPEAGPAPANLLRPELQLPLHEMDAVSAQDGAPSTRLTGWCFLLRDTEAPEGTPSRRAADAMLTADGWVFSHFREGPYVVSAQRALRQAESLPSGYQPRLLSVPQLYMLTLWLHGDPAADASEGAPHPSDLLIPLSPAPPGITAQRQQRVDALLPVLTSRLTPPPLLTTPA